MTRLSVLARELAPGFGFHSIQFQVWREQFCGLYLSLRERTAE